MTNERLRTALDSSGHDEGWLAEQLGLDPKSVQRWITKGVTPRRRAALEAARLLKETPAWLWPDLDSGKAEERSRSEMVAFYPHRAQTPRRLWLDLLSQATQRIWLLANASLFLPEENPESIELIRRKAEAGVEVRILMGDPDSPEMELRGVEERLYEAIPARIRMALSYYSPLVGVPGVEFGLHRTSLYNSIFVYDDQMLVNQHAYGIYGYLAPILHLRQIEGGDLFDTYVRSFDLVRQTASPIQESQFWRQRESLRKAGSSAL